MLPLQTPTNTDTASTMPFSLLRITRHSSSLLVMSAMLMSLSNCKPPVKELPADPAEAIDVDASNEPEQSVDRLPVNRTIHDINGRPLEVRIIGRADTFVRMTRLEDNYKFDFPVTQLSQKDRKFVLQFPESVLSPINNATPSGPEKNSGEAPYIKTRTDEIERIIKDIQTLTAELRAIEPGTSKARTQQKKIEKKEMEILHLESQIETYRQQNKPK